MSVNDLKHHYETTTQEYPRDEKEVIITLVRLVEKGKLQAFKDPTGEIRYHASASLHHPLYVEEEK